MQKLINEDNFYRTNHRVIGFMFVIRDFLKNVKFLTLQYVRKIAIKTKSRVINLI